MASAPRTTATAFDEFDEALNLDPDERAAAQARHREVTEWLTAQGLSETTFLQGSFARMTMLKPLKDVDMVIVLPTQLAEELRRPGGSAEAMCRFRDCISAACPDTTFDPEDAPRHALQVQFGDCPFSFDLVPAHADPDGGEDVFIADREKDRWERSNARTLNRVVSERNKRSNGRFVHQARMLKSFKAHTEDLKQTAGLLWEGLAYEAVTESLPHATAVAQTLDHAAKALRGPVYDPTGADELTADWGYEERLATVATVERAADSAQEALMLADDGEHEAPIDLWHHVLGEPFPSAREQSEADALNALASGGVTGTGRAVRSARARQPERPSRAWRCR